MAIDFDSVYEARKYGTLRAQLHINEMDVSAELVSHPSVLMDVLEVCTGAIRERDKVEQALSVAKAIVADELRMEKVDGKAPSEAQITSRILLDDRIVNAVAEVDKARSDVALWNALAEAMRFKGSSLKRLAELTVAGFIAPSAVHEKRREDLHAMRRRPTTTV